MPKVPKIVSPSEYDQLGFGVLNPIEKKVIIPAGRNETDFVSQIYSNTQTTLNEETILGTGPFKAICLRVEGAATSANASWLERAVSTVTPVATDVESQARVKIRARIPELHSMLPLPVSIGPLGTGDDERIDYYPTFVAKDAGAFSPKEGTLVWVTFGNIENMSDPIYLGPVLENAVPTMKLIEEAIAAFATAAGGLLAGSGPLAYKSSAFGPNASNFGPHEEEAFANAKHKAAMANLLEEWQRHVREPKGANWERINRFIQGDECGNWGPLSKTKSPTGNYTANAQFEWCGAVMTCPFRAVALLGETVQSGLMSTYRIYRRAVATKEKEAKKKKKDRVIPAGRTLNVKEMSPGDLVLIGKEKKDGSVAKYGRHITMCWGLPGKKDPLYAMGYRDGDFVINKPEEKPAYKIAETIPAGWFRTLEGNAIGLGPVKGTKPFQGIITKLRPLVHNKLGIAHIVRYKAEDFTDWPPPPAANVTEGDLDDLAPDGLVDGQTPNVPPEDP